MCCFNRWPVGCLEVVFKNDMILITSKFEVSLSMFFNKLVTKLFFTCIHTVIFFK